jgi:hypothetical protein
MRSPDYYLGRADEARAIAATCPENKERLERAARDYEVMTEQARNLLNEQMDDVLNLPDGHGKVGRPLKRLPKSRRVDRHPKDVACQPSETKND